MQHVLGGAILLILRVSLDRKWGGAMTNGQTAVNRTTRRSYCLTAVAVAITLTLTGGCSQADSHDAELRSELRELRESMEATTEKTLFEELRSAARGSVPSVMMAVHWEIMAEHGEEKALVKRMTDALRSEHFESAFISANRHADDPSPDEFETELLARFAESPSPEGEKDGHPPFAERRSPVDGRYEYYQPVFYKNDCFACHSVSGQSALSLADSGISDPAPSAEGDLIAIVKIRLKEYETAQK